MQITGRRGLVFFHETEKVRGRKGEQSRAGGANSCPRDKAAIGRNSYHQEKRSLPQRVPPRERLNLGKKLGEGQGREQE